MIKQKQLYFGLSLLVAFYYGIYFYYWVFSHQYLVQDDARQHIVWLQRFVDPELFSQDLIADYFFSLAPLGFKSLYIWFARLGIEPLLLAKLLPPILGLITTVYIFWFTLEIMPRAIAGFWSCLLFNQLMWLNDDLVSATHRAFIYPLFAAFLYYLAKQKFLPCLFLMLIQGLFYPHILLVELVILSLRLLKLSSGFRIKLMQDQQPYIWWLGGLMITAIALYPITQKPPEISTTITFAQMQAMPEFNSGGRNVFLINKWQYFFVGSSGLSLPWFPTIVWLGLALPWLLKTKSSVVKLITKQINILLQVIVASLIMFAIAHFLLPKLHLPSRYTYHTLRFVMAISTAIVITILSDNIQQHFKHKRRLSSTDKIKIIAITLVTLIVIIIPGIPKIFIDGFQNWKSGTAPAIYEYLGQQPKDTLVASISLEADNIPAFSQRSILVSQEFAMAYHPAYYQQIQQRAVDLLEAQYSLNTSKLISFINQYGVDYFLVDKNAFSPEYLLAQDWLVNSSWRQETQDAIAKLQLKTNFSLKQLIPSCSKISTDNLDLVSSNCIVSSFSK